ncbi:MAG TPA: C-GCAxxG-C-C family protein [Smithella sp.]|nr:C_GCAxxG_C_C family protein [Smithella sp.]MDM7986402.1 C-GCAxxG-C-C family protein [Smithella sp.]HNY51353.1 C-GCAxxG-C-C family protein [Smithella sp.]HOG89387.1 C-GCAxxG-C-C family protein [Smithella sp.]HOU51075.1 C-GCAxxG-C-C family protein [Smithella sp.]
MDRSEQAVAKFVSGYNCAQSVLFAFCEDIGLDKNEALKITCGFGAGMGRKEEVCGAVTGGIMAIGLKHGRGENETQKATEITYAKVRELMNLFSEKHGSYLCRQLLNGCDLSNDEGHKLYLANDYRNKVCKPCVQSVVEIVEEIMNALP